MRPENFNKWRAENDLPALFEYFRETLPYFDEWLVTTGISQHDMFMTFRLGEFFNGNEEKVVIRQTDTNGSDQRFCIEKKELKNRRWISLDLPIYKRDTTIISTLTPYFKWAKERTGKKLPIMWDKAHKSYTDHFFFGGSRNIPPNSRTHIWRGPELVKLGGLELPRGFSLGDRNLDFADFDGLKISGDSCSSIKHISCSSFRQISIENCRQSFFTFSHCKFEDTRIIKSEIYDFQLIDCDLGNFTATESTIFKLSFIRSLGLPFINNCDLKDLIEFRPETRGPWNEDAYRLLKNAYNGAGQRKNASHYYYLEQVAHRKNLWNAKKYYKYSDFYPTDNSKSWSLILKSISKPGFRKKITSNLKSQLSYITNPKYLRALIEHKTQWIYSFLDWALWGHGVKLHRLAFSSSAFILMYSIIYFTLRNQISANFDLTSFFDYIYFSIITFTTLGYGDILPKTTLLRLICGSEAFLGAFMMGLIVAGFSNKKAD